MTRKTDKNDHHLLRQSPVGIATLSTTGKLLSINVEGLNIIGYRKSDLLGTRLLRHVHHSEREYLKSVHKNLHLGISDWLPSEHRIRHAKGHYIFIRAHNAVATDRKSKPRWIISVFLQNTTQMCDKTIEQSQDDLLQATQISLTQEMTANLAHEINQPLAAIAMYARITQRLIKDSNLKNVEINHALEQLTQQAYRASDIVTRLRSWSKISSTRSDHVNFATLVKSFYPLILFEAQQVDLNLDLDIEIGAELSTVHIDPGQIQHVVLVFVRNSIEEHLTINCANKTVRIKVQKLESGEIEFSVQNSAEASRDSRTISDVNADMDLSKMAQSTDLMLSDSIILSHGGKIGYKRTDHGCGVFWFTLPIKQ